MRAGVRASRQVFGGSGSYIATLDGWRAVAITIVMVQHASDSIAEFGGPGVEPVTEFFHDSGRAGVQVFFALSGFLICSRLLAEERDSGCVDRPAFYIRRAFRILPPFLVVLAALGLLGVAGAISTPPRAWLSALLFSKNYVESNSWYLGHFWSLAVEEHFYLLWPLILLVPAFRQRLWLSTGIVVAVAIWRFVDLSLEVLHPGLPVSDRTDTQLDGLLWGCIAALLCTGVRHRRLLSRLVAGARWWVIAVALLITQAVNASDPAVAAFQLALRPILIVALVMGTVLHPGTRVGRALELRPVRWLGRISYSLYLWQQLFLVWSEFQSPRLTLVQTFPVNIVCAVACATASYYVVERPMIKVGRRLESRRFGRVALRPAA